jgi:hypothetical protein
MTDLSPAAQAVLDAANNFNSYSPDDVLNESRWIVAAALRVAASQLTSAKAIDQLRAIAAELEDQ